MGLFSDRYYLIPEDGEAGGNVPTNCVAGVSAGMDGSHPKSVMNRWRMMRRRRPLDPNRPRRRMIAEDVSLVPHLVDSLNMIIHTLQSIDTHSLVRHVMDALPKDGNTNAAIMKELSPSQIKQRKKQFGEVTNMIKDQAIMPVLNKSVQSLEMAKKVLLSKQKKFSPKQTELTNVPKRKKRVRKLRRKKGKS